MFNFSTTGLFSILSLSILLTACGSDSGSTGTGTLNLNITDAPVDSAAKVVVTFSGVTIKPEEGAAFDIDFVDDNGVPTVKSIDLLTQQGANSEPLLADQTLEAGHYNWMRLKVLSSDTEMDSYIELDDGSQYPLYVPSGDQTGLKLNQGFDIADGGAISFTIDFDLRRSVLFPNKKSEAYKLKPTLRIIENENVGHITGMVGNESLSDESCVKTDYAIYVFAGENIVPDDIDDVDAEPVTTALLSDAFKYSVGFLEAGTYTLAFTCQAKDDMTDSDEVIDFIGTDNVSVTAGATTTHDFN